MKTIQEAIIAIDNLVAEHGKICTTNPSELESLSREELVARLEKHCFLAGLLRAQAAIN